MTGHTSMPVADGPSGTDWRRFRMNGLLTRACVVAAVGVALGMWGVTAASASSGGRATIHHGALGPAGIAAGPGGALRLSREDHAIGMSANAPTRTRTFAGYQTAVTA